MKQIIQSLKSGKVELLEIPSPNLKNNYILVQTTKSLISTGTERMLIDFGKSGYLSKIKQHPEKVKQLLDKI